MDEVADGSGNTVQRFRDQEFTQDALDARAARVADQRKQRSKDNKVFGAMVGGTAALTAAAVGGMHLYNGHVDRPVEEAVQVGQNHRSEEARIAGYSVDKVKFELTPDGQVQITLPKEFISQLNGVGKEVNAIVNNPDGTSQSVDVGNVEYHGLGHYSADVSTMERGTDGGIVAVHSQPDNWREMTANPQPGGLPATLEIGIDGTKGPHSEYTIVEPPTPPAPAG